MDFLWLFLLYLSALVIGVSAFCCLSGSARSRLDGMSYRAEEALSRVLPERLYRCLTGCFHSRSVAFVVLHVVLDALVFGEYFWEVQGYSLEMELPPALVFLPYAIMAASLYYFYQCCTTDPGVITKSNEAQCVQRYHYDQRMFLPGRVCGPCDLLKPARSKHCGVCGVCVQRFDHHCVWVNNCIGGRNLRYFLLYLLTLTLTVLTMAGVIAAFLLQVVLLSHMMSAAYVDSEGYEELVGIVFIIQHLFLTFPRILLTLGFLLTLTLLLGGYTCFMLYLCATNQTTNEWYKTRRLHPSPAPSTPYSRGIMGNLQEAFRPDPCYYKKKR